MWPTLRAAVGLGVKAPEHGILKLMCTLRTHGKIPHGGLLAVIRNIHDNSKAGAAVGAVGKGVVIAVVMRIHNLTIAVLTGAHIRGDDHILVATLLTVLDKEVVKP
jgi:hypothetical protein